LAHPLKGISPQDFTEPETFYQMGVEPVRVDVLTSLPGLTFGEAWVRKETVDFDGERAFVVGREDLLSIEEAHWPAAGSGAS